MFVSTMVSSREAEGMTKTQIEKVISDELAKLMKLHMGKGPELTKCHILKDCIVVRKYGILTPSEKVLARSEQGAELIKEARQKLFSIARDEYESVVSNATGMKVLSIHTDIDVLREERVEVYILEKELSQDCS